MSGSMEEIAISAAPLRTKYGQASTSTPRTRESNRSRLGGLFSSLSISSSPLASGTPTKSRDVRQMDEAGAVKDGEEEDDEAQDGGGTSAKARRLWSWLSPSGPTKPSSGDLDRSEAGVGVARGTAHSDGENDTSPRLETQQPSSRLLFLPDEILVQILLQVDSSVAELLNVSLVCRHLHDLVQAPVLWYDLFLSAGYALTPGTLDHAVAVSDPPPGHWGEDGWVKDRPRNMDTQSTPRSKKPSPLKRRLTDSPRFSPSPRKSFTSTDNDVEIHYPTLFRSRLTLQRQLHDSLTHIPQSPPHQYTLSKHTNAVYCLHLAYPYLFTGSRDRTIQLWRLPELTSSELPILLKSVDPAHAGSVLTMTYESREDGKGGLLVTGSSDQTAAVWNIVFGSKDGDDTILERIATLRGCSRGVLGVGLSATKIALSTKEPDILVYDRAIYSHIATLSGHEKPVNSLAMNPNLPEQMVSVSSDGHWIIWDLNTSKELRRGAGDGHGLACVAWEGDYILTGGNDRLVSLYDANSTALIKTFEGNKDLVRAVSLGLRTRLAVSGGYDGSVRMWHLDTGEMIRNLTAGDAQDLMFAVHTQVGRVFFANRDGLIQILTYGAGLPYRSHFA